MPSLERTLEMTILIRAINQTTGAFGGIKLAAVAALGAVAAGLAYSVKQAADFQQELTTLATGAGEAANKLQQVGEGIKQVSINTGTSTDDLIKSMFLIESAGIRGASGVQTLQTAAEGAKVGNIDLTKTTQVLLTMLHDYHQTSSQAVGDTNSIIATVQHGTMTMDDLNGAMKNVLSIASAFHIKLADVEGALATMSVAGDKGSAAGTHLAMMLRMLSNPATAAANEMAAMGLNSINVANEMRISLPLALQEIETAVRQHFTPGSVEFNRAITTILGGTRSGVAGLELMNKNLPIFRTNAENAAKAAATAGSSVNGWALVQQDFNQKLSQTQASINVAAIDLGTFLLPILGKVFDALTPLIAKFTNWVETSQGLHTTLQAMGNFLAGPFISVLSTVVGWVGNVAQGVYNLIQAFQQGQPYAIALAVALTTIVVAVNGIRLAEFIAGWVNTFNLLRSGAGIFANLGTLITGLVDTALPELTAAFGGATIAMTASLAAATLGISLVVGVVIAAIAQTAISGQNAIQNASADVQQTYKALGNSAADLAAKQKASAIEAQGQAQSSADMAARGWHAQAAQTAQDAANTKSQYVLDQQQMADAAEAAAQRADAAWVQASNDQNLPALLKASGWSSTQIAKYLHQPTVDTSGTTLPSGQHLGAHASGIMNSPYGHFAMVGERGPELMYVPRGSNIYPNGTGPGGGHTFNISINTMAGSRSEVMRMVDILEQEIAHRFRSQTPGFALPGLT